MMYIELSEHRKVRRNSAMQATLVVTVVLHVLTGVFWAGTTFVLARTGGYQAERFFRPQMAAATIAVLTGGVLWYLLHHGPAGLPEHILGVGALCALLDAEPSRGGKSAHRWRVTGDYGRVHGSRSLRLSRARRESRIGEMEATQNTAVHPRRNRQHGPTTPRSGL